MKEVNEKYFKKIYLNILKAIIVLLYFLVLNVIYENVNSNYMQTGIKVFTMIILFISIYIFEKAYKKDSDDLAVQGIEILILSAYTLTIEHITNKFNFGFRNYSLVASYIFAIYFILKCIIIYTKGRKEIAQNLSDIREIVKKDKPIKKEATKKKKENKEISDDKSKAKVKTKNNKNKIKDKETKNEEIQNKNTKKSKQDKISEKDQKTSNNKKEVKVND